MKSYDEDLFQDVPACGPFARPGRFVKSYGEDLFQDGTLELSRDFLQPSDVVLGRVAGRSVTSVVGAAGTGVNAARDP